MKCTEFEKVRFDNLKCEFTAFCVFFEILVLPDGKRSGGTHPLDIPALRAAALEVPALRHFYSFKGGTRPKQTYFFNFQTWSLFSDIDEHPK